MSTKKETAFKAWEAAVNVFVEATAEVTRATANASSLFAKVTEARKALDAEILAELEAVVEAAK